MTVESSGDEQRVRLTAQHPGQLLLHWGVIGGQGYKGGWRLPGDEARPQGTVQYKKRALQTPFRQAVQRMQAVQLMQGCSWADGCTIGLSDNEALEWSS